MSQLTAEVCPECGAPLELSANRTCKWCHARIARPPSVVRESVSSGTVSVTEDVDDFALSVYRWTLRPDGEAIIWEGPDNRPVSGWDPPMRDMMYALRDGMGQPWVPLMAAESQVDRAFCRVVGDALPMGRSFPTLCGVVPAMVSMPGTDPQWAQQVTAAAEAVHQKLTGEKVYESTRWDIELQEAKRRHVEEVPALDAWARARSAIAPEKHRHRRFL